MARFFPIIFVCVVALPALAQETHFDLRAEADAAYQRKDYASAREALELALEWLPDSPRYLRQLAAVAALQGDAEAALGHLRRLAALGVTAPIDKDPDLASLQGQPEFIKILHRLSDNAAPHGEAEIIAELPGRTGVIEGLVFQQRTGDLFLGDAYHRTIWRRDHTGQILRFTAEEEELFGFFGLAIDVDRDTLWAATPRTPRWRTTGRN